MRHTMKMSSADCRILPVRCPHSSLFLTTPCFSFDLFFSPVIHHDYSLPLVSSTPLGTLPTFLFWACFYFFPKTFLNKKRDYYLLYVSLPLLSIKLNFMCSFMLKPSLIHPEQLVGFTQLTFSSLFLKLCTHGLKTEMFLHVAGLLPFPRDCIYLLFLIPIFFVHSAFNGHWGCLHILALWIVPQLLCKCNISLKPKPLSFQKWY